MILPMVLQDSLVLPKGPTKCLVGFFLLWKEFDLCVIPPGLLMGSRWVNGASVSFRYPWLTPMLDEGSSANGLFFVGVAPLMPHDSTVGYHSCAQCNME